jgi:integrase
MMPKKTNERAGFTKNPDGTYRVRLTYKGQGYERQARNITEGQKWRTKLFADLERCPDNISYKKSMWEVEIDGAKEIVRESFVELDAAINWMRSHRTAIVEGTFKSDKESKVTLNEFVAIWQRNKVRALDRSMLRYETSLNNQILPYLGKERIRGITTSDVRNWVGDLHESGTSPDGIRKAVALLKQILKLAVEDELIRRNPVTGIELPVVVRSDKRALSTNELRSLVEQCPSHKAMILVLGLMGLRISELRALRVASINLESMEMHINRAMTINSKYQIIEASTKTKTSRTIKIPEVLRDHLAPLLVGKESNDYVFVGSHGNPINDGWFRKSVFGPAVKELGWSDITVHNLRHTCASLLISAGSPITTVSKVLGHGTVLQTLNTYSHYYKDDMNASMAMIGEMYETGRGSKGDTSNQRTQFKLITLEDARKSTMSKRKTTVGPDGLEPSTHGLKVRCSTN